MDVVEDVDEPNPPEDEVQEVSDSKRMATHCTC